MFESMRLPLRSILAGFVPSMLRFLSPEEVEATSAGTRTGYYKIKPMEGFSRTTVLMDFSSGNAAQHTIW